MKQILVGLGIAIGALAVSERAEAANYVVHLHGRGNDCWVGNGSDCAQQRYTPSLPGWTMVTLSYNGSDMLDDAKSTGVDTLVRNTISSYCGSGHSCVVHCFSAGCMRMLKAVSDLRAQGNTVPGLLWAQASASAAGGSRLASIATKGLTGMLGKLVGMQHKIDFSITPDAARNRWGYIQDDMGVNVYHLAGKRDICKSFGPVKFCGNFWMNNGVGDGAVTMDSAAGYSSAGAFSSGCLSGKYPFRLYDTGSDSSCGGVDRDHMGVPEASSSALARAYSGAYTDRALQWSDNVGTAGNCSNTLGTCDNAFSTTTAKWCQLPGGQTLSGCTEGTGSRATSSTTAGTCAGKCGGSGGGCWCDPRCSARGDCCADYVSSNCASVLQSIREPIHRGSKNGITFYSHSLDDLAKTSSPSQYNAFYVYPNDVVSGVTTPLYRCRFSDGRYLLTARSDCWDPRRSANGTREVLIGYTAATSWDNTISLWEMWNNTTKDRIYTTNSTERTNLTNAGWVLAATHLVWAN
jgi:hypothetical protein